jgi:hypothetical protein
MKRLTGLVSWTLLLMLGLGVSFTGSSCHSFGDYCTEAMDCQDGNDADIEACVESREGACDLATLYGCEDEFNAAEECELEESDCNNDVYTTVDSGGDNCEEEHEDLSDCMSDSSPL